ncbi:MAG TPA: tetratricopeptide repeat protein [Blastocatellia bacterium]|nr:tetratricopeptide repeat protein [Blastocatellia bacterium]
MSKNKYLFGLVGLAFGFIASFFWTQYYNSSHARTVPVTQTPGMQGAQGGQGGQPSMAAVQETIAKAKSNPKDFDAQLEAAKLYNQIGMVPETISYLEKAYEIDPAQSDKYQIPPFIAQYYFDQKKYEDAETWYRRAAALRPDEPELHVETAASLIYRQSPDPAKAILELQKALKINPADAHALGHMIDANILKKDARAAEESLARLKQAEPASTRLSVYEGLIADLKAGKPVSIPKE